MNSMKIAMPKEGSPTSHFYSMMSDHTIISKVPKVLKKKTINLRSIQLRQISGRPDTPTDYMNSLKIPKW